MYNTAVRILALAAALAVTASLGGCSKGADKGSPAVTEGQTTAAGADESVAEEQAQQPDHAEIDLSASKKPAVTAAAVSGVFGEGTLTDIYGDEGDDRRFTEEAGLYGCPVRFECDDLHTAVISFRYDPEQLHGTPPENFRILHYNEQGDGMEYITSVTDKDSCEVSAPIDAAGVYLLVDEYARRVALGQDISGLTVPEPQDEIYDGEIPYYEESRPFTVTIPLGCYGYENIADLELDGFAYHSFLRIAETHSAFVWVDISYITPDSGQSFDELMEMIKKQLPQINNGGEVPKRTLGGYREITSPDGTKGIRVNCTDVYAPSGINPELTYRTICDYYPDSEGGVYEIRAQFLDNAADPDKATNSISERILGSFTLKDGAGLRIAETPEDSSSDEDKTDSDENGGKTLFAYDD